MIKFFTKRMNNKKGFTLIELVVVIAILGILAVIAIPRLGGFQDSAKVSTIEANHKVLINAVNQYYTENNNAWPGDNSAFQTAVNTLINDTVTEMQTATGATHTWATASGGGYSLTTTAANNSKFTAKYASGLVYLTN